MTIQFKDNALTTLATSINSAATQLTVAAGTGANFPAVSAGSGYFVITMEDASGNREFIYCNNRSTDVLGSVSYPLVRGYNSSTARAWSAGDSVDLRWNTAAIAAKDADNAAAYVSLSGNNTIATGTTTTSKPEVLTQTWNDGAVTFTARKTNVTDTASASASLLEDWQVGGVSKASLSKAGALSIVGTLTVNSGGGTGYAQFTGASAEPAGAGGGRSIYAYSNVMRIRSGSVGFEVANDDNTKTLIAALSTGEVTNPNNTAFHAEISSTPTNVTGDGTGYRLAANTENYDVNADYDNGTYQFASPVNGKCLLSTYVQMTNLGAAHTTAILMIITSNRNYIIARQAAYANLSGFGDLGINGAASADMDAGDTTYVQLTVYGSTKTVSVQAGSWFAGQLVN